jgi:hypothetical protein
MADIVIHKIESSAKIEALVGLAITTMIGLLAQKIYAGEEVPVELFWGLALLIVIYFGLQLLFYLRFYIEKIVYFREQEVLTQQQLVTLEREITKLGLVKEIKQLEARE